MNIPIDYEIDETVPDDRRTYGGPVVVIILAFFFVLGFAVGYAFGDVPIYVPAQGFDMCQGSC